MILGKNLPTWNGERERHGVYLRTGQITEYQYDDVISFLDDVESGTWSGDYGQLMSAYRKIIPPPPHIQPDP